MKFMCLWGVPESWAASNRPFSLYVLFSHFRPRDDTTESQMYVVLFTSIHLHMYA